MNFSEIHNYQIYFSDLFHYIYKDHFCLYFDYHPLGNYYKNLENLGMMSKKIQEAARKIKAIDIENYMAELCGNAFKSAWMIKATLRKG